MSPDELRDYVMMAPGPVEGPPIQERGLHPTNGAGLSARCVAKAILLLCQGNPALLDGPALGKDSATWKAAVARWPGVEAWLGGNSDYAVDWASNIARRVHGIPTVSLPADAAMGRIR